ncbi:MAG: hypothetical protein M1832_005414 [Thelocarpon impressellum]|nr:MAG: hypothetical protein M1832_005414 [Thelocarpon impressellum]
MRPVALIALGTLVGGALGAAAPWRSSSSAVKEPPFRRSEGATEHQSGGEEYLVLLSQDQPEPPEMAKILADVGLNQSHPDVGYVFENSAFRGFAGTMKNHCITALNAMTEVAWVEKSVKISSFALDSRARSPWGLQRMSQDRKVVGDASKVQFNYQFDDAGALGQGVDIYIVDTGVKTDHLAFGGRARMGFSIEGAGDLNAQSDDDGHGTHVAGTAAGDVFGVAPGANIIGVKVLNAEGVGSATDAIRGLDFVVKQHDQRKTEPGFVGSIASMSFGLSERLRGLEQAVNAATDAGVHVSVAAGNTAEDACTKSPASAGGKGAEGRGGKAVTVGSMNIGDTVSKFSSSGQCVDVYAPGEAIVSAWIGGPTTVNTLSGTSMATPLVSGMMAYLMGRNATLAGSPAAMKQFITQSSFTGALQPSAKMFPNDVGLLVNNGIPVGGGQPARRAASRRRSRTAAPAWFSHIEARNGEPQLRF